MIPIIISARLARDSNAERTAPRTGIFPRMALAMPTTMFARNRINPWFA